MGKKPNIVFIFSDQQRADTCGCYGQTLPVTPNLDRMAQEGVRFENAFTCQPVCGPARAALQTGKWPTETGCFTNHRHLPADADTLARRMKSAGYETAYIGKWHLASGPNRDVPGFDPDYRILPIPQELRGGYDYWLASDTLEFTSHAYDGHMFDGAGKARFFPVGKFRADAQTDWVLEYLDTRKETDAPFFLFISYIEPHHQNDHDCYEGPAGSRERFANFDIPGDLAGQPGDWVENFPDYLGCCHSLDANTGRIRRKLAELGLDDDTLVIYTSDHGSHFRTRNSEYKRSCHEASVHIPLIACGPGFTGGQVREELVSLLDLPRTFLRAAEVDAAAGWRGLPLQETLMGHNERDCVFVQLSESQVGRCIRTREWKYSVRAPELGGWECGESDIYVEDCLYCLTTDPHERTNLVKSPEYAAVRGELRKILLREIAEAEGRSPQIVAAG